jgi:A/G-specific adenine glycosylase
MPARAHRASPAPAKHSARIPLALLAWYDVHKRELPWRFREGAADPYRVWLSEIMLQQTTVAAVKPYFAAFLTRWPSVKGLAAASLDDVLGAWAGLGYYSRARNLHRTAQTIVRDHRGRFPHTSAELRKLPGVGDYTAAAIAAIAFGERAVGMEANGLRVVARLFAIEEPLPKASRLIVEQAQTLVPAERPGDFQQALMDLGSAICTPKDPDCPRCPLKAMCKARALGIQNLLPRKMPKSARPLKRGAAFVAVDSRGAIYLEKRPEKGLLGAMLQPPLGPWNAAFPNSANARGQAPFTGAWKKKAGVVRHGFTHFELEMEVYVASFKARPNGEGAWFAQADLAGAALPTVMRKVIAHALDEGGPLFQTR